MENKQVKILNVGYLKHCNNRIAIQKQDLKEYLEDFPEAISGGIMTLDGCIINAQNGYWIMPNDWDYLNNSDGTERYAPDEDIDIDYLIIDTYNTWIDFTEFIIDDRNLEVMDDEA